MFLKEWSMDQDQYCLYHLGFVKNADSQGPSSDLRTRMGVGGRAGASIITNPAGGLYAY